MLPRHSLGKMILTISRIEIQNRNQKLTLYSFVGVKYIMPSGSSRGLLFLSAVADVFSYEFPVNISRRLIYFLVDLTNF